MTLNLDSLANIATIVGAIAAVIVLIYTAVQVRQNTLVSRGQFWLELEKMFSLHDEIHIKLRPGGEWAKIDAGPQNAEDWAKVEDYMGLFEHCEIMLEKGLIDWETFGSIFSYRLNNILANERITKAKLINEKDSWKEFVRLLDKLKITIPHY